MLVAVAAMIAARSTLPQQARLQVEAVEGVRIAHPLTAISVIHESSGRKTPLFIIVYDTAGGPRKIIAGSPPETARGRESSGNLGNI